MSEESRYIDILRKYSIPDNLTLEEVRKRILKEAAKYHPDHNKEPGAEEKCQLITADAEFIRQLIKKYKRDYVYVVNGSDKTKGDGSGFQGTGTYGDSPSTGSSDQGTKSNGGNHTNGNDGTRTNKGNGGDGESQSTYESSLKEAIDKAIFEVIKIKTQYSFILELVDYADYVLSILPKVDSFSALNSIIEDFSFKVAYYTVLTFMIYDKNSYEDSELDLIVDEMVQKLKVARTKYDIENIEHEYYRKSQPIINRIKEEIKKRTSPIIQILNDIEGYKSIKLDTLYVLKFRLNDIKSLRKIDKFIAKIFLEVRNSIRDYIRLTISSKDRDEYDDYATQVLLKIDNVNDLGSLNDVVRSYDAYVNNYINKKVTEIRDETLKFIDENNFERYELFSLNHRLEDLVKAKSKLEFNDLVKDIYSERLKLLVNKFRNRLYRDEVDSDIRYAYIDKLRGVTSEEMLKSLIADYEKEVELKKQSDAKVAQTITELRETLIQTIKGAKDKYAGTLLEMRLDLYLDSAYRSNSIDDIQMILGDFQGAILHYESQIFLEELSYDSRVNSELSHLHTKYFAKLYRAKTIFELQKIKDEYYKERAQILNEEDVTFSDVVGM